MSKPWFGVKTYGIGIGPKGFGGWVSMGVFLILGLGLRPTVLALHLPGWITPFGMCLLLAGLLALIAFKSDGDLIRWRWRR